MIRTKLIAVTATVALVLVALGPGVGTVAADTAGNDTLSVSVGQTDSSEPTVTVTENASGVENASVAVATVGNDSYAGTGNYTTDTNGTVSLPAPESNVTVEVDATVDNMTASTTADLTVANETVNSTFGMQVSTFVQSLISTDTVDIGQQVATFATENNPGNAPDHAGPPDDDDNETDGPGNGNAPNSAGPPDDDDNETDGPGNAPDHAGPPDDDDNETEQGTDDGVEDEDEDEADEDDDNGGGPPEGAKGNARGR